MSGGARVIAWAWLEPPTPPGGTLVGVGCDGILVLTFCPRREAPASRHELGVQCDRARLLRLLPGRGRFRGQCLVVVVEWA